MYDPKIGRFLQTDPIGYGDGMNWYNYVHNDSVNMIDPMGLEECPYTTCTYTGQRCPGSGGCVYGSNNIDDYFRNNGYYDKIDRELNKYSDMVKQPIIKAANEAKKLACKAPAVGGGGSIEGYLGFGGGLGGGATFNPRNGQFGVGFDVHVGVGLGVGAKLKGGKSLSGSDGNSTNPILDMNFFANGNANWGAGYGYSKNLFGTSPGQGTHSFTAGPELSASANIGINASVNSKKLYDLKCGK